MSRPLSILLACCLTAAGAWAQQNTQAGPGIYTCVDAKGRRLTSDRPIVECLDREQKELNSSGTVRRTLPPTLTAAERAEQEEKERRLAEERQRQAEERRLQKVLLSRYPNQVAHDAERAKALKTVQDATALAQRRVVELQDQRRKLQAEAEFYKSPEQWPPKLKRQFEDIEQQVAAQQRYIAAQEEESRRLNLRFDEELARLKMLWAQAGRTTATAGAAPASAPAGR